MARTINRLSAAAVARAKPGLHADGGGLYLQVTARGAKSWKFRFTLGGRTRDMGLGSLHTVRLAEARDAALNCRKKLLAGVDPIDARKSERAQSLLDAARSITFRECSERYIASHESAWSNDKHAAQWRNTLGVYAYPVIGEFSVQSISTEFVLRVLEPIWTTKPETAHRVRGRVEAVLNYATTLGFRTGDNPARWRGRLSHLLPAPAKIRRVVHHPALPYSAVASFLADLRQRDGVAAAGLEFTILTAARTSETIGARWAEMDLAKAVWSIPADRMKRDREHRVPLSNAALRIVESMRDIAHSDFVFPGGRPNRPLSNMALLTVLKRMDRQGLTVHGFRSSFRDWAAETTGFPGEVAEMALAHAIPGKVEQAYRRGDLFDKRRKLMDAWAEFCSAPGPSAVNIVEFRSTA